MFLFRLAFRKTINIKGSFNLEKAESQEMEEGGKREDMQTYDQKLRMQDMLFLCKAHVYLGRTSRQVTAAHLKHEILYRTLPEMIVSIVNMSYHMSLKILLGGFMSHKPY